MRKPPSVRVAPIVRKLRRADISQVAALVAALPLWQRYAYSAERCARDLRGALARGDRLLVATLARTQVGLAWIFPTGGFGRLPYLKLLAVAETAQGRGVGEALLRAGEAGGSLMLLVSDFNRGAQRFYRRQGYRKVGTLPGLVLADVAEVLLWKSATGPSSRRLSPRVSPGAPPATRRRRTTRGAGEG